MHSLPPSLLLVGSDDRESKENEGGKCNLRFDDTDPSKEEVEYVESIKEDVRWLGANWEDREFYASDYYDQLYEWAVDLIKQGKNPDDFLINPLSSENKTPPLSKNGVQQNSGKGTFSHSRS